MARLPNETFFEMANVSARHRVRGHICYALPLGAIGFSVFMAPSSAFPMVSGRRSRSRLAIPV